MVLDLTTRSTYLGPPSMLAEAMMPQDPTPIAQGEDLTSIREMPGDATGEKHWALKTSPEIES